MRLILVTGMPRSGTTTVGNVLSTTKASTTLYEPMNYHSGDAAITRYFEIPGTGNFSENDFQALVKRIENRQLNLKSGVWPEDKGLRRIAKYIIGGRSRATLRRAKLTPGLKNIVWKDPIASLSTRAFLRYNQGPVLATYRSPYAVAASFKRLGWSFDITEIFSRAKDANLELPTIPSTDDINNTVVNSSLLWGLVYNHLFILAQEHTQRLKIIDLDDIVISPKDKYRELITWLDLTATPATHSLLKRLYAPKSDNSSHIPTGHPHSQDRDISKVNTYWRELLSSSEQDTVRRLTIATQERIETLLH